jgi:hypothetical protein
VHRLRPLVERVEPRRVEGLRVRGRLAVAREGSLPGGERHAAEIRRERRVAAQYGELGHRTILVAQSSQAIFARTVGGRGRRGRIDLVSHRARRVVDARHRQQKPALEQAKERRRQHVQPRALVEIDRRPVGKEHLDAAARRRDRIAGDERHVRGRRLRLALVGECGEAVDDGDVRRRGQILGGSASRYGDRPKQENDWREAGEPGREHGVNLSPVAGLAGEIQYSTLPFQAVTG